MRLRKIVGLICVFLLMGCSVNASSLENQLTVSLEDISSRVSVSPNNRKEFYSYYIEPSVGRREIGKTYNIFVKNGVEFLMNLNVSSIINELHYSQTANETEIETALTVWFNKSGSYIDYTGVTFDYECWIYNSQGTYYAIMNTEYMTFYASGSQQEMTIVVPEMLKIAKTILVNEESVVTSYFSKEVIEYEREQLQLYDVMIPENGRIEEMMVDGTIDVVDIDDGSDTGGEVDSGGEGETETDVSDEDAHDNY
ncbi:MAG: hypothetical protein ACK5LZ_04570 [Anaerorhabdus sp.]